MKIKSGGGISSNKTVQSQKWKTEPKSRTVSPAGVAQQGMAVTFRKEELFQGPGYSGGKVGPTGIANARQGPSGAGPGGGGRTIYAKGSQSPTPAPKPIGPTKDTLSEYGPTIPGRK